MENRAPGRSLRAVWGLPCPHPQELFLVNILSAGPDSPALIGGTGRKKAQGQPWPHPTTFPIETCMTEEVLGLSPGSGPREPPEPSPAQVVPAESEWTQVTAHLKPKHQVTGPHPPQRTRSSRSLLVIATKASGAGPASMGTQV